MTGRGLRKATKNTSTKNSNIINSIGRGRRTDLIPPMPGFPM
jgi:hypothetical protein